MIPKDSTPIKNKILINILARGLLSKDEMRIIFYIIRWSWGFDEGERRQDWTKKVKKRQIADDIEMNRGKCCTILNKMIKEKKVRVKDKFYQFNEHYEEWKKFTKGKLLDSKKVYERETKSLRKVNLKFTKGKPKVYEKEILGMPNNQGEAIKNKDVRGGEHMSKETLKENKETLKEENFLNNKIPEKKYKLSRKQIELNKSCITKFGDFLKNLKGKETDE